MARTKFPVGDEITNYRPDRKIMMVAVVSVGCPLRAPRWGLGSCLAGGIHFRLRQDLRPAQSGDLPWHHCRLQRAATLLAHHSAHLQMCVCVLHAIAPCLSLLWADRAPTREPARTVTPGHADSSQLSFSDGSIIEQSPTSAYGRGRQADGRVIEAAHFPGTPWWEICFSRVGVGGACLSAPLGQASLRGQQRFVYALQPNKQNHMHWAHPPLSLSTLGLCLLAKILLDGKAPPMSSTAGMCLYHD
jgi:hypothetical protein